MAGKAGDAARDLDRRLAEEPFAFDFFQAVRRLECAHPDKPPIGHSQRPEDDPIRFGQLPSSAFAPAAIASHQPATADSPARMLVSFTGLLGPNGPMPLYMTEYAMARELSHDHSLARFLDVFNHRMISLLYRAWACNQMAVSFERGERDRYGTYIGSLFGIGMETMCLRDAVADVAKRYFSGRLSCQVKPAEGLSAVLGAYFRVQARIEEFVGHWVDLPDEYCCRLGESADTGSLGHTAIVGKRVWECQHAFRIGLGPMKFADYERMLPGGDSLVRLVDWVRNYIGDELEWDAQLVLRKEEIPKTCLGQLGRLGWSTWTLSRPPTRDADDLVLRPFAAQAAMQKAG
jgi:type VI secretion system protein ImpH